MSPGADGPLSCLQILMIKPEPNYGLIMSLRRKYYDLGKKVWTTKGEEQEPTKEEIIENLKLMESDLGDEPFFWGESFGFLGISFIGFCYWFYSYETFGNFRHRKRSVPSSLRWGKRCAETKRWMANLSPTLERSMATSWS